MKIPSYEKIELKDGEYLVIKNQLSSVRTDQSPYYLDLTDFPKSAINDILTKIDRALEELGIKMKFPYPLFIITPLVHKFGLLRMLQRKDDLPLFFTKKTKRLRPKEQSLLNKSSLMAKKVYNQPIEEKLKSLQENLKTHKALYLLGKKVDFLEQIQKELQRG